MTTLMEKSTDDLMKVLSGTGNGQLEAYMENHFSRGQPDFVGYMDDLFQQKHLKRQDVLLRAGLPYKYGYKLLTGESHTTNRDKILRICLAMELTLKETQRVLKLYGMNELYPKNQRDVILIVALGRKQYDLTAIDEELIRYGLDPLWEAEEVFMVN